MSGKILVVDDLEPNLRLLEAKLKSEYYTVFTAKNGYDAIDIAKEKLPDIILLDVMMPGINGFETCEKLKSDPITTGIPVVMVTALTEQEDRIKGLEAGADDFITKPIDEFHLFARVRSLVRIKELFDELKLRDKTITNFGGTPQLDGSEVEGMENKRKVPVLILVDEDNKEIMLKGLQVGIDDYILNPLDINELMARTKTLLKRKKYQDSLRHGIEDSINASVLDQLTGMYNRRYLENHLGTIFEQSLSTHEGLVLLTIDIDNFKKINDRPGWGHHIGDEVLREVSRRIKECVRDNDLAVRHGGEEFIVVLTSTNVDTGIKVAERIRAAIANVPVEISAEPGSVNVTVSIGDSAMRMEGVDG